MDHLEQFRGNFEVKRQRLERLRDMVRVLAEQFLPENYQDLVKANGGDMEIELNWVNVADPVNESSTQTLDVVPVLYVTAGDPKTGSESGLYTLALYGKLPDGDEQAIGGLDTCEKSEHSGIVLNKVGPIEWDCADAEIFLKLSESALLAQYD